MIIIAQRYTTRAGGFKQPFKFDRTKLPTPTDYYLNIPQLKIKPNQWATREWADAICPFHGDHAPSLRIHTVKGCYACMVCGAKGRDVLAFHMAFKGLSFLNAVKDMGAN